MTRAQVINFIRYYGVVLQSAKGLEPSLTVRVAGAPIRGSWWNHRMSHEIFAHIQHVHKSNAVLVCPLASGKITYIHRRLWPFFIRAARKFPSNALDRVREVHLSSGRHQRQDIPFPDWATQQDLDSANNLSDRQAAAAIDVWLQRYATS